MRQASKMEMIVADHRDRIPTNVLLLSHARSENDLRTLSQQMRDDGGSWDSHGGA